MVFNRGGLGFIVGETKVQGYPPKRTPPKGVVGL